MAIFKSKKTEEAKPTEKKPEKSKKVEMTAWSVLESPYISEKATDLSGTNRYVFKVFTDVNKNQIKKAVEELYNVDVVSVNVINVRRKKKRLGKFKGWTKGFKKAIVEIKEGQQIDVMTD